MNFGQYYLSKCKENAYDEKMKKCIEEALFYGGLDNIAVVIAQNRNGR